MATRKIKKVLIANRGEIAVRVIRSCKEMGISTVAIFSDVDRAMPHVLAADEAYHIGPAPSAQSYLVMDKILEMAKKSGADAIHPGYGFLSENPVFAQRVSDASLVFIGPDPSSMKAMGDKTEARKLVQKAKVPTVPGTDGAIHSEAEARAFSKQVGFPVLIKAAAGGGGKGMRVVHRMEDLASSFAGAQSEAKSAFGDGRVYLEKYLENPRHVEFQILADQYGNTVHLGERECSIQRRHQKVVEETPSPIMDDTLRKSMGETAVMAAKACNYVNAGTIEFLVDRQRNFYFLEMNTRLQVEHPITEMRTGIDVVAQQLHIAMGEKLGFSQENIEFRGHAIECRICAEDPYNNFLPSIGTITHLRPAQGFGIREDRGVNQQGEISVYYDPMISKLIAWGQSRTEAIHRMERALQEYEILGVKTNIPFCLYVLKHPKFIKGEYDTHFIADHFKASALGQPRVEEIEAAAAVVALLESKTIHTSQTTAGHSSQHGGRDHISPSINKWKQQRLLNLRQ